ncbi:hypothetical protein HT136_01275 [Novosphingobium profundi]|uniref:hypothetical protein n=1 Tax=Novosphingobium profundi TaxID=1774954 RepID=UPI001BDB4ACD|nr:hypothetical protein [Novosphingobium profundi]MBT0666997.1 hypothetical protein [Novosphingobium profundi]
MNDIADNLRKVSKALQTIINLGIVSEHEEASKKANETFKVLAGIPLLGADRIEELQAALTAAQVEIGRLRGRQHIPLVDQNGREVGREFLSFGELHRHEVHVDDDGTTWTRPTAWAYRQACIALTAKTAQAEELAEALEALLDDEPCQYDHHGYCQSHFISNPCEMATARAVHAKYKEGGR